MLTTGRRRRPEFPLALLVRVALVTQVALVSQAAGGRTGHVPQPPDLEGWQPRDWQFMVPASVLLPTLVAALGSDRAGRAAYSGDQPPIPQEEIPLDLNHLHMEEKLQRFFSYFQLPAGVCQERFVCELTSDPDRFDPASAVFLQLLVPSDTNPAIADLGSVDSLDVEGEEKSPETRLERLQRAAATVGGCDERYASCPIRPESLLSESALRLWRWSTGLAKVQFSTVEL